MQQQRLPIDTQVEIRITPGELTSVLAGNFDFLWHFARKMCRCGRCASSEPIKGDYRIMINGYGDFQLYHTCRDCRYPLRAYVDLSQDPDIRKGLRHLWLTKIN